MNNETQNNSSTPKPSSSISQTLRIDTNAKKGLVAAIIVFLVLIVFGILAAKSLPGDALYSVKTNVLEELNSAVQFGTKAGAEHEIARMETRLREVQALKEKDSFSDSARTTFENIITKHTKVVMDAVQDEKSMLTPTAKLDLLGRFAGVAAAMETVSESDPKLAELGDFMEDQRRESVSLYREQVDRFVERETPANIFEFIKSLLSNVSNELQNGQLSEDTINDAEVYINRVGPAMAQSDYPKAINSIAEAMRFIAIEKYGANADPAAEESEDAADDAATSTQDETAATATPTTSTSAPQGASTFSFPE